MDNSILLVDDDPSILRTVGHGLRAVGFDVDTAAGGEEGIARLDGRLYDLLLVDIGMPVVDGFGVMQHALRHHRSRAVIVVTGQNSVPVAVEAMRAGALDFITKPVDPDALERAVRRAMGSGDAEGDKASARAWRDTYAPGIVGEDPRLLEIFSMMERVADTECNVLITGPSGTGKELVARAIHNASRRADNPCVALNCAAIPADLIESEIFGHAKGAFTGAMERREGKFQVADGGSLFLDEIGEMDISLQGKFLRVIQEREFTPIGDSRSRRVDVRIIAATNQDLLARCREGAFREDLYYRLNVIPLELPPLRERSSDVPRLAESFIQRASRRHQRPVTGLDPEAAVALKAYAWPGNVRELENLIERTVVLKQQPGPVSLADLPASLRGGAGEPVFDEVKLPEEGLDIKDALEQLEVRLTLDALRRSQGNKARAAELLGLKRTTLIERLKRLNLDGTS